MPDDLLLLKGYLLTLPDGYECVLRNDKAYADNAAVRGHGILEGLFVKRPAGALDRPGSLALTTLRRPYRICQFCEFDGPVE